jgi:hypothetical protein
MDKNGQIHAQAAFPTVKTPQSPIDDETVWAQSRFGPFETEKNFSI